MLIECISIRMPNASNFISDQSEMDAGIFFVYTF